MTFLRKKRFRFLVEWDPTSFLQIDKDRGVTLNSAVFHPTLQGSKSLFQYGIIYCPIKKGISLLFHKHSYSADYSLTHFH